MTSHSFYQVCYDSQEDHQTKAMFEYLSNFFKSSSNQHCNSLEKTLVNELDLVSPISVMYALGCISLGCSESMQGSFVDALGMFSDEQYLQSSLAILNTKSVKFVNMLLVNKDMQPNREFIKRLGNVSAPFPEEVGNISTIKECNMSDPSDVVQRVDSFVSENTNGMINKVLQSDMIGQDTLLILVNALYLNMKWLHEFDPTDTYDADFFCPNRMVTMPMMHENFVSIPYYEDDTCQKIQLDYVDRDYTMEIALEKNSLSHASSVKQSIEFRLADVAVTLPKFTQEISVDLKDLISKTQLKPILEAGALNNINSRAFVSNIIHKVVVKVGELGTEAAAVTAVVCTFECYSFDRREYISFNANRMFYYSIIHKSSRHVLFDGKFAGQSSA